MAVIHIHVDVDDLWIYGSEYGIARERLSGSVYEDALPRFLDLFATADVKATFFVVGRDLERVSARAFCREAVARGHEIANHSLDHPVDLHRLSAAEKERQIRAAHEQIAEAVGRAPVGFRAPGYYLDRDIVRTLRAVGYRYDSSILPSYVSPALKLYIRAVSGSTIDKQFGTPRAAFASQRPRRIADDLVELPVSVLPLVRLPMHSTFSFQLPRPARLLVNRQLRLRGEGVLLFHAIDAASGVDEALATRVLALRLPLERRIASIREAVGAIADRATTTSAVRFAAVPPERFRRSRVLRLAD